MASECTRPDFRATDHDAGLPAHSRARHPAAAEAGFAESPGARGLARRPDGTPVANANVWLSEVARPTYVVGNAVSHTREDGTFELPAFFGITYLVRASIYLKPFFRPHCAEPQRLDAIPAAPLTLVLTRTDDVCRSGG